VLLASRSRAHSPCWLLLVVLYPCGERTYQKVHEALALSQLPEHPLCDYLPAPVITQRFDLLGLLCGNLQQTEPLRDPVRGYAMQLCKLLPGQVVTDHFLVQLPGIDHRITKGLAGFSGQFPEGDGRQRDQDLRTGSLRDWVGVPPSSRIQLVLVTDPDGRENDGYFGSDLFSSLLTG